ncbi:MAG: metal-dependent hydrolase [Actinomycetota bacterium]|nr:metal-dependent hydrolase [Actinomycetota bacterium]
MPHRASSDEPPPRVEIRRSARRRRTASARVGGDRVVVLMPAGLSQEQEQHHVVDLLTRLRCTRQRLQGEDLMGRSRRLSQDHLAGRVSPGTVRWVTNQGSRWGSCSTSGRSIRISSELEGMPEFVVDAVLVQAFLQGVCWARARPPTLLEGDDPAVPEGPGEPPTSVSGEPLARVSGEQGC